MRHLRALLSPVRLFSPRDLLTKYRQIYGDLSPSVSLAVFPLRSFVLEPGSSKRTVMFRYMTIIVSIFDARHSIMLQ